MFCRNCGKQIEDKSVFCPYCGVPVNYSANNRGCGYQPQPQSGGDNSNTLAVVGFILSFFIPLAGLICSIIGYNKAKNEGLPNKNFALAGIIISIVSLVMTVVLVIVYVGFFITLIGAGVL